MKPTISNAFNDSSSEPAGNPPSSAKWNRRLRGLEPNATSTPDAARQPHGPRNRRNPHKSLAAALASMQADLRETEFGWSLELSPMQAIDALDALTLNSTDALAVQFLCQIEQSTWRDGEEDLSLSQIAARLAIPHEITADPHYLILDELALKQLVSLCQPSRLVAVAVRGELDARDVTAMTRAIESGQSPLLVELRAEAAIEVLGDRSVVLHVRERNAALGLVAANFRHYLAALRNTPSSRFAEPELWQLERLLDNTGALTVRPIETQQFSTSIDVGINTTRERFTQPADRSLIYDLPSHTWHDEP